MLAAARFVQKTKTQQQHKTGTHMKNLLLCAVIAMIAAAATAPTAIAAESDPVVGTWQLNASKSTFSAGPAIKNQTRKYSQSGDKITLDMTTTGADGKEVTTHTTYQLNGQDFPVTGTPDYDSLAAKRIGANSAEFVMKKGGKEIGTTSRTVSKDGKTLTAKSKITTASGEKTASVLVFDRK
jgi:hypothetical protein